MFRHLLNKLYTWKTNKTLAIMSYEVKLVKMILIVNINHHVYCSMWMNVYESTYIRKEIDFTKFDIGKDFDFHSINV